MDRFVIAGFDQYDGEYEFDAGSFNIREWRWIKRLSGHDSSTIVDGYRERDADLLVAFAVIAMCRDGKIQRDEWERVADEMCETQLAGASLTLLAEAVDTPLEESTPTPNGPSTSSQSEKLPPNVQRLMRSGRSSGSGSEELDASPEPTTDSRSDTPSTARPILSSSAS